VLLVLIGLIWILQGFDVIKGSGMSGHGQYAALGLVVGLIGIALFWLATRMGKRSPAA
jgi:hypothetical protein